MICHQHLADRLSFIDLTTVSLLVFLVDYRIKSTGTLIYPKASFGPALELSKSPRPQVFCQQLATSFESIWINKHRSPRAFAFSRPISTASYSAVLLGRVELQPCGIADRHASWRSEDHSSTHPLVRSRSVRVHYPRLFGGLGFWGECRRPFGHKVS